jgi:hypothetical protein
MVSAGETIIAGKVPGERIATTIVTANSATITTTETTVMTVVAAVVAGRIYRITADIAFTLSVANDTFFTRIREDSVTGNQLQNRRSSKDSTSALMTHHLEVEYTADVTEDKTIELTFVRSTGTGNISLSAAAASPAYLYVDYIRG